ncbi:tetratricopeptide repeat protein [candidate division GN15 bacterium]|nr:tetratricopeptide repeat protein [candidate division GN15 bacterium]
MKRSLIIFVTLLALAGCSQTIEEKRDDLYAKGMEQLERFQFEEADSTFREVLWTDTLSFKGPAGIALTQERQFFHWDALNYWMRIAERNPQSYSAALAMMRIYRRLDLPRQALIRATFASNSDSAGSHVQIECARLCLANDQYDAARRYAATAFEQGESKAMTDVIIGHTYLLTGQPSAGDAMIRQSLTDAEPTPLFYHCVADYFESHGLRDSAMHYSRAGIELPESDFNDMTEHFRRALRLGYLAEARGLIDSVTAIGGTTSLSHVLNLYYYWAAEQPYQALVANGELAKMQKRALSPHVFGAMAHAEASNFTMVVGELNAIANMLSRGNFELAFKDFMSYRLAILQAELDDPVGALHRLRNLETYRLSDIEHSLTELYLVKVTRQPELFEQMLDSLRQIRVSDPMYLTRLANVCGDSAIKRIDDAAELYAQALSHEPAYRPAFENWLVMLDREREYARALEVCERYPDFIRYHPDLAAMQAMLKVKDEQFADGVAELAEAMPAIRGYVELPRETLWWLHRHYRADDARQVAATITSLAPNNPDMLSIAAETYNRLADHSEALSMAERALEAEPDAPAALVHKAYALHNLDNPDEAREMFADIYARYPDHRALLRFYPLVLARSDDPADRAEAENLARRGVLAGLDVLEGWLTLCHVYMLVGRPDLAYGEANRAAAAYPEWPQPQYYMGYAMYLEEQPGAREKLEQAIEMGLQGEDLKRAREALRELS